jgi:hypothetical protein
MIGTAISCLVLLFVVSLTFCDPLARTQIFFSLIACSFSIMITNAVGAHRVMAMDAAELEKREGADTSSRTTYTVARNVRELAVRATAVFLVSFGPAGSLSALLMCGLPVSRVPSWIFAIATHCCSVLPVLVCVLIWKSPMYKGSATQASSSPSAVSNSGSKQGVVRRAKVGPSDNQASVASAVINGEAAVALP